MKIKLIIVLMLSLGIFLNAITLDETIKLALENNLDLKAQGQALKSAKADKYGSYLSLIPSASLGMNYGEYDAELDGDNYSNQISLTVSQPLFNGGKIFLGAMINKDVTNIEQENYRSKQLEIIANAESKYFFVLECEDLLEIAKLNLTTAENNLAITQVKVQAGTISKAELLQLQSEQASKEVDAIQAENRLQNSYQDLMNYIQIFKLGKLEKIELNQHQELIDILKELKRKQTEDLIAKVAKVAKKQNPNIKISHISKSTSQKNVWMAAGNFLPSVNLSYSKSWDDSDIPMRASDYTQSDYIGLNVSVPIFPIANNGLNLAKANYNLRKAEYNSQSAENMILLGIQNSLYTLIANAKMIDSARMAYEYAQVTNEQMQERYKNGLISTNDLLSAALLLNSSRTQYTSAKYNFLKAKTSLLQQLGTDDRNYLNKLIR